MTTPDPIATAIQTRLDALDAGNRLSAWSLIISFLGDAISPRGGEVSAGAVQMVMERLGIGHGAVRTAISRLSADGWIERTREGRNSFYRLSPDVAETVQRAERRIYAPSSCLPPEGPQTLVIGADAFDPGALDMLEALGALMLNPQLALCFTAATALPESLRPPATTLAAVSALDPGTDTIARIAVARQRADLEAIRTAYAGVPAMLEGQSAIAPGDAMALRCLLVHEWRRIALRIIAIPAELVQPDDPEPETRALVARIYAQLVPASEAWLDDNATTPNGALPPPDGGFAARFAR
ncbi:PaaX family transcriptional regulator C-terminal domain-containing protein [Hoeflea sp.]|uniref:PaaX family transcriptional regulator C-terminal domain-containing protein n=1 Tax=Hoeflea sp. TaxID=1940281 RepID=UPI003749FBBD